MSTEKPGIYAITHTPTGTRYVGGTVNLSKRWSRHRKELRSGTHFNRALQAAWTADGPESFAWTILAIIERSELRTTEQRLINALGGSVFNERNSFGARRYVRPPDGELSRSPEWRARQAETQRQAQAKRRTQVGDVCSRNHVIDGTYTKQRIGRTGTVSIRILCQDCARKDARERNRRKRGIPADWPSWKHYNHRG